MTGAEGSHMLLRLRLNKQVPEVELRSEAAPPLIPVPSAADPSVFETSFTAVSNITLQLHLRDAEGRTPADDTQFSIRVTQNQPAVVKALFPGRDTSVSPLQEFQVQAQASDDFGLLDFGIEYSISGGPSQQLSLRTTTPDQAPAVTTAETPAALTADFSHRLDLEAANAAPDDVVVYSLWADDQAAYGSRRRTSADLLFA